MLDTRWQNYFLWLQERGLRPPTGMCQHCGYLPAPKINFAICYSPSLAAEEERQMQKYSSIWHKFKCMPLNNCKGGQLCALQRRDLQHCSHVLLLGAASSEQLFNVRPRFASERGHYHKHEGWGETQFMLTFHPRDVLRYPASQLEWQRDISEAIRALRCL